ncbi:MAG: hypothetical protein GY748_23415 [Planctomycetaceae bacterium]|nr:hypothetical protein [Planctomycetaceae bacterium]
MPILPSLIINKASGSVGAGFHDLEGIGDPIAELNRVYNFDWSTIEEQFEKYLVDAEKDATPKKRLTKEEAKLVMSNYFMVNKQNLPTGLEVEAQKHHC